MSMTNNDDPHKPTLDDNPGLEHDHATPEGELMAAAGSTIRDPHGTDDSVTLDDDPGLEHDAATEAGHMMTAAGSTGPKDEASAKRPE